MHWTTKPVRERRVRARQPTRSAQPCTRHTVAPPLPFTLAATKFHMSGQRQTGSRPTGCRQNGGYHGAAQFPQIQCLRISCCGIRRDRRPAERPGRWTDRPSVDGRGDGRDGGYHGGIPLGIQVAGRDAAQLSRPPDLRRDRRARHPPHHQQPRRAPRISHPRCWSGRVPRQQRSAGDRRAWWYRRAELHPAKRRDIHVPGPAQRPAQPAARAPRGLHRAARGGEGR